MYKLYGGGVTRALGPQMVLEEGGIPYELIELDEHRGDHKTPEYRALNPAGYIPALVTPEGAVLHEAAAIMIYLAERHGLDDLMPAAGDPDRGLFLVRLFYLTNDIQPSVRRFFKPEQYTSDETEAPAIRRNAQTVAMDRWSVLDGMLERAGPYNLGERFSFVDLYMALWAAYGLETPDSIINTFPAIGRCFTLTAARPKVAPMIEALQSAMRDW